MIDLLSRIVRAKPGRARSTSRRANRHRVCPRVDGLEDRKLLAVNIEASGVDGDLYITGDDNANTASVEVSSFGTLYTVTIDGYSKTFYSNLLWGGDVHFTGRGGGDTFVNNSYLRTDASGDEGNDYLYGGYSNDVLYGGDGSDGLHGRDGADVLYGGDDTIGNYLDGGNGSDRLYGSPGADTLKAGDNDSSTNYLYGSFGSAPNDRADYMYGGNSYDYMYGGAGGDRMFGGLGADVLYGESGDDQLDGGDDGLADTLRGGTGADTFQQEWYPAFYLGFGVWIYSNRDAPADFSIPEGDSYYDN